MHGVPTKASKLFDPRVEVLSEIFGDEPDAFPTGEFAEEEWLDVLVDVGLKNKLDVDTILQCAKKVCAGTGGGGGGGGGSTANGESSPLLLVDTMSPHVNILTCLSLSCLVVLLSC